MKEVYTEWGGGMNIPMNEKKNFMLMPTMMFDYYGMGNTQTFLA